MKVKRASTLAVAALAFTAFSGVAEASQPASQTMSVTAFVPMATFKSCKALNKKYPHGVGKKGAKDSTSGIPVRNFKRSRKLYKRYSTSSSKGKYYYDLDRDNDGIACEKR